MARQTKSPDAKVLFVRHGRTPTTGKILPGRAKGLHLSEEGQAQAAAAGAHIAANFEPAALYCSPLERTRETAAPIARATGIKAQANKGLLECDFGDWTGQDLKKLNKLPEWKILLNDPARFRFPNGESLLEMQARVASTMNELAETHRGETIVVVSHADPIKMAVVLALRSPIGSMHRLDVAPCSITTITYGAESCTVTALSATEHLQRKR